MKVLLSAYACLPDTGTEPGFGWNWAVHLAQRGVQVWCFTAQHNREAIEEQLREQPVEGLTMVYVAVPAWIEWLRQWHYQTFVYMHYWHWQRAAYRRAVQLQSTVAFDLVHHVTYGSLQMGSLLSKLKIPFVFGPVGGGQSAPLAFRQYMGWGWRIEQLRNAVSNSMLLNAYNTENTLRSSSLVLTTNQETYVRARQLGAKEVQMMLDSGLPPAFYPGQMPSRLPTNTLRLLWVGSMIPRKGVPILLDVLTDLPSQVTLTLVGSGSQEGAIKRRIRKLRLEERVQCVGRVSYAQVRKYYATHDVFVFSSLRDSFGTQLLEAMAYGLPVITLDHQGARTFVPDEAGVKVSVETISTTVRQMKQAIRHLQLHPQERLTMGRCAYDFAQTQQWPRKVDSMIESYESVLLCSL